MLLIQSDKSDVSTRKVISWLKYFDAKYMKINNVFEDFDEILFKDDDFKFKISNEEYSFRQINSFWFRRKEVTNISSLTGTNILNKEEVQKNISNEYYNIESFFYYKLLKKGSLQTVNNPFSPNLNRLHVFHLAKKQKLLIPKFIITNSKKNLLDFKKGQKIVLKPSSDIQLLKTNNNSFLQYTKVLTYKEIRKMPRKFFPTMFQLYIKKDFEIRSFYLNKKFYSMAIFSQENFKTRIDFRRYDYKKPNLNAPYQLPIKIENKLRNLFDQLNLNCGSIDLLHTVNDEYFFL
jgi:ATP-GRASP peptide maturase of grasp-with-spasm system